MQNLPPKSNPLLSAMRQPKFKLRLPSRGSFWPVGSIQISQENEYLVYSMTAKDELLLKNPAAISNGQAIVSVIENCIPAIKDAWHAPSIDLDTILLAIRIATYGNIIKTPAIINDSSVNCNIDLIEVVNELYNKITWNDNIEINDELTVYVKPLTYRDVSKVGQQSVETQKILNVVNNDDISESKKLEIFKTSFGKLTDITLNFVKNSISKIKYGENEVSESVYIFEFMEQCDTEIFNKIKNHIDKISESNSVDSIKITSTNEMLALGAESETLVKIDFTPTNFFAQE